MAKCYLTPQGEQATLRGTTCRNCRKCRPESRKAADVVKVTYRCTVTGEKVNPDVGACVLFPTVNDWAPLHT